MNPIQTSDRGADSGNSASPGNVELASPVRISDLTRRPIYRGANLDELPTPLRRPEPVVVTPARRGGRLTLNWYDWGVVALVLVSLIAVVACLIGGQ